MTSGMSATLAWWLPIGDWQFWATGVLALAALAWLLRGVLPIPWLSARHARRKRTTRVELTIEKHRRAR